jgi:hypothetical protein
MRHPVLKMDLKILGELRALLEEKLQDPSCVQEFRTPAMIKNVVSLASSNGKVMPSLRVVVQELIEKSDQMRFDLTTIRDLRVIGR